jgi:hypothetical protein
LCPCTAGCLKSEAAATPGCHHPPPGRRNAPPDDRLQRMIQYSRDASDGIERPRRTGYPAFAGYDDLLRSGRSHRARVRATPLADPAPAVSANPQESSRRPSRRSSRLGYWYCPR